MKALTVTIPAGWQFQGTVVRGPDCYPNSFPTFRAYSRDGLTEIRLLPAFNWSFHPAIRMKTIAGCLPFERTMSAAEFLNHFVELIPGGVHVVGPMSIAQPYRERVENVATSLNANNRTPGFHATVDTAAVRVETVNGSFVIEQRVRVWLGCRVEQPGGRFQRRRLRCARGRSARTQGQTGRAGRAGRRARPHQAHGRSAMERRPYLQRQARRMPNG